MEKRITKQWRKTDGQNIKIEFPLGRCKSRFCQFGGRLGLSRGIVYLGYKQSCISKAVIFNPLLVLSGVFGLIQVTI